MAILNNSIIEKNSSIFKATLIRMVDIDKKDLPTNYYPQKDVFFETADCPQFSKLQQVLTTPRTVVKPNILRKDKALTSILGLIRGTLTPAEAYNLIENQKF